MILIAHRGNTNGPMESWENEPTYIDKAIIEGFDVEVDVWYVDGTLFLGHDKPQYGVSYEWFEDRLSKLWIHCKNTHAIVYFKNTQGTFNYFWHDTDVVTLTSLGYVWAHPGNQPIEGSIAVLPEKCNDVVGSCIGVCSDYVQKHRAS